MSLAARSGTERHPERYAERRPLPNGALMTTPRKSTTPQLRVLGALLWLTAASHAAGCGDGGRGAPGTGTGGAGAGTGGAGGIPSDDQPIALTEYTMSYRTAVRIPGDGAVMAA